MGLSASQARLLTLTARLSDLELHAQQISNSKIRLSMESEQVSEDYAAALDKQDLSILTGYSSSGTAQYENLNYYNLTGPDSPLTTQYCLTDTNGNVLVTQAEGEAFEKSKNAEEFCALMGAGATTTISSGVSVAVYQAALDAANKAEAALNAYGKDHVKGYTTDGAWAYSNTGLSNIYTVSYSDSAVYNYLSTMSNSAAKFGDSEYEQFKYFSYGDTNDQVTYLNLGGEDTNHAYSSFNTLISNIGSDMTKALQSLTKMDSSKLSAAMSAAISATESSFEGKSTFSKSEKVDNRSGARDKVANCNDIICGKEDDTYSIDVSQVLDTMLTYFDQYCAQNYGGITNSSVGSTSTVRSGNGGTGTSTGYLTETDNYESTTTNPTTVNICYITSTGTDLSTSSSDYPTVSSTYSSLLDAYLKAKAYLKSLGTMSTTKSKYADYYTNLYDKMCDGYITMSNESNTLNSSAWIQSQIENGNLVLNKCANDDQGNVTWSSTPWSSDTDIKESSDESAIAKAEAKYQAEMAKIQTKDKKFDLELQNVDTEHQAVQTEVDSVQKVIDKNIERNFKLFQNA